MDYETCTVASRYECRIYRTDAFYDEDADFNKWKALEEALDFFGRQGWTCFLDADTVWPKNASEKLEPCLARGPGYLFTPRRRIINYIPDYIPDEKTWSYYPIHHQEKEFAGYSQVFHASDHHLGPAPWHETNWKHAGGADSFFQAKWGPDKKVRPPFEVLHIGETGKNWCGRVIPLKDGSVLPCSASRLKKLEGYLEGRRHFSRVGASGQDRFAGEKIPKPNA